MHLFFIAVAVFSFSSEVFATDTNITGLPESRLRTGNVGFSDIPGVINHVTDFVLGFAATIAVLMIIVGALRISIGSLSSDKQKGKDAITYGIIGFVIAASSWIVINAVINNL